MFTGTDLSSEVSFSVLGPIICSLCRLVFRWLLSNILP